MNPSHDLLTIPVHDVAAARVVSAGSLGRSPRRSVEGEICLRQLVA